MEIPAELLRELEGQFIDEIGFMLDDCEESFLKLEVEADRQEELTKIFRVAHCIKGSASSIALWPVADFAHRLEDCLSILRNNPKAVTSGIITLLLRANDEFRKYLSLLREQKHEGWNADAIKAEINDVISSLEGVGGGSDVAAEGSPTVAGDGTQNVSGADTRSVAGENAVKVTPLVAEANKNDLHSSLSSNNSIKLDVGRVDNVLNLVGELVVIKSQILEAFFDLSSNHAQENALLSLFEKTMRELQEQTMTMRLSAIKPAFLRVQRIIRELSLKLDKPVDVIIEGEDIEVDRAMIDLLTDPLIHIVRNALDHGIETQEKRKAAGKPKNGTVKITAKQSGGRITVEVSDDGAGVIREKVIKRAIERNLMRSGVRPDELSDAEVNEFLFMPGFSTAEKVTDLSGRGVGLDVARSNIQQIKGRISLTSQAGKGSSFHISLPLTTAITDGIVAVIEGVRVIIPIDAILEIADLSETDLVQIDEKNQLIKIRKRLIPMFKINEFLRHSKLDLASYQAPQHEASEMNSTILILRAASVDFGIKVSAIIGQSQVLVKPLGPAFMPENGLSGVAILGDGKVGLVLDIDLLARLLRRRDHQSEAQIA